MLKVEGVSTAKVVLFHQGITELRRCENCVFFLPVNILTGVARRLLEPHDTLPCVLISLPNEGGKERAKESGNLWLPSSLDSQCHTMVSVHQHEFLVQKLNKQLGYLVYGFVDFHWIDVVNNRNYTTGCI